jgi:hypothetical protein
MLDEAGRAPGLEPATIRGSGPVTAMRTEPGIAHERLGDQADQFLATDGFIPRRYLPERKRNIPESMSRFALLISPLRRRAMASRLRTSSGNHNGRSSSASSSLASGFRDCRWPVPCREICLATVKGG